MSLTKQDLSDIHDVVLDALDVAVNPRLDNLETKVDGLEHRMEGLEAAQRETNQHLSALETSVQNIDGRLEALEADVKELYRLVKPGRKATTLDKAFRSQSAEEKLRTLYHELLGLAEQLHIEL